MEKIKQKTIKCTHNWIDVCVVYYPKINSEGMAMKCTRCHTLGFVKFKSEQQPIVVDGFDIFQAEYLSNGKSFCSWDAHL